MGDRWVVGLLEEAETDSHFEINFRDPRWIKKRGRAASSMDVHPGCLRG